MELTRGLRDKLEKYVNVSQNIVVDMGINGNAVYDFSCFGVDAAGKLSDDRYMIFYNQVASPAREITYTAGNNSASFNINLSQLPQTIDKLIFTVSIDGNGIMREMNSHVLSVKQNGVEQLVLNLIGADFNQEKAIITAEIYRKDGWRINAVAKGFNGGLAALLANYGGSEAAPQPGPVQPGPVQPGPAQPGPVQPGPVQPGPVQPVRTPVRLEKTAEQLSSEMMSKISLSKDKVNLEKHVVSLSKCVVDLRKKTGYDLGNTRARVVVVLDYSGSMSNLYRNGTVQRTLNRLVPLGLSFDDNGSVDVFLFSNDYRRFDELNLSNYENYVQSQILRSSYQMAGTYYAPVLNAIIVGEQNKGGVFSSIPQFTPPLVDNTMPTFVLFITDGENMDKNETDQIIRYSSQCNVFIQFVGIGNERFQYLRALDDMQGRARDNTGFVVMKSLESVSDSDLYNAILEQFGMWLRGMQ